MSCQKSWRIRKKKNNKLSKILWWSLIIVIFKNIQTIDLIFIVMLTFRTICFSAFFKCFMSNLRVHTESVTEPFILTIGVDCSNSVNHDQGQMFSYSKYSFVIPTCCWNWTCNLQMISLKSTFQPNALSTAPCILARQFWVNFWDL